MVDHFRQFRQFLNLIRFPHHSLLLAVEVRVLDVLVCECLPVRFLYGDTDVFSHDQGRLDAIPVRISLTLENCDDFTRVINFHVNWFQLVIIFIHRIIFLF